MTRKFMSACLLIVFLLTACIGPTPPPTPTPVPTLVPTPTALPEPAPIPVEPVSGMPEGTGDLPWWNDSTFYQIFVRSFYDSSGDGIGDFNGLIGMLDYLNDGNPETTEDLGVTGIWLLPIHPSPSYHGYDVLDYYDVNPDYGTMEDFQRLLKEARQRNIRIIIDLVINHTSEQHPWFRASRNVDSEYREWYVWEETDPGFVGPWGQRVWHPTTTGYYYGVFWGGMPDLNHRNPEVTEQIYEIARFWLEDVGVDGFRIDGAQHLIEEGDVQRHTEETHAWFQEFREFIKGINPEALLVGEVWDTNFAVSSYVQGDQFDLAFNFDLGEAMLASANSGSSRSVRNALGFTKRLLPEGRFGAFLTNHDIDRVMTQLRGDESRARVAATILLTLPGVPFVYYGEEIGMIGQKPDERIRTPMQWTPEQGAGFTTGIPWQRPQNDYQEKNVQAQELDPQSLLNHYRALIFLRNQQAALRIGELVLVESNNQAIYSVLRHFENDLVLVLINLGSQEISEYNLSLADGPLVGSYLPVPMYGEHYFGDMEFTALEANPRGGLDAFQPLPVLPPYSSIILQLQTRP